MCWATWGRLDKHYPSSDTTGHDQMKMCKVAPGGIVVVAFAAQLLLQLFIWVSPLCGFYFFSFAPRSLEVLQDNWMAAGYSWRWLVISLPASHFSYFSALSAIWQTAQLETATAMAMATAQQGKQTISQATNALTYCRTQGAGLEWVSVGHVLVPAAKPQRVQWSGWQAKDTDHL